MAEGVPDFSSEIRPILAENCFHCHGPDEQARKAKLRLDTFQGATTSGDLGGAITPGNAGESELVHRIFTKDADELMPPPSSKRKLTSQQKQLLKDWIASGAKYEDHWAWLTPTRPDVPVVRSAEKVSNPIDAFVLRRLEENNLDFSPPTTADILLRRLSLDLIGLPPTPDELDQFERHYREDRIAAVEAAADRLLASPHFGERWARPWLDLARYADSNGFQADQLRPSWAFRDWVIRALNANMPYDQFTIEQLAGDLLPDSTLEQKIATGFHRTVTCNVEAGVSPEGNRVNQVVDRVNTTGTVWLGVTLECAQCHDHKYDPFTMTDYYGIFDFFNHTPLEVQLPSNKTDVSHDFIGPYLDLPLTPEQQQQAKDLDSQISILQQNRETALKAQEEDYLAWERLSSESAARQGNWEVLQIAGFTSTGGENHEILKDGSVLLSGTVPKTTTYTVETTTTLSRIAQLKLEALANPGLPGRGPGRGDNQRPNFVLKEFTAALRKDGSDLPVRLHQPRASFSQRSWDVAGLIDGKPATGWAINPQFGKSHWAVFDLVKPIDIKRAGTTTLVFTLPQDWGQGRVIGNLRLSARSEASKDPSLPASLLAVLETPSGKRSKDQKKKLRDHFEKANPSLKKIDDGIARLKKQRDAIKPSQSLVMVEMKERRKTHILKRGNFLNPDAQVTANTPALLPGMKNKASGNRLDLARWLVRNDNPLTARVAVNRWWAELFSNGIVATLEDFGTQSEPPTHPDLLDWLAVELVESGWDMKHLLKIIVLSNAYQQSSRITAVHAEKDPRNLLLSRAPRFRMDAERLRDNALAISGLLSSRMFGKPVMPYQPPGLWRQTGRNEPKWEEQKDENRWRRGIYIVYRRAAPYPSMVNFDAPDRAACTVRRARTNTPSQALTMLNDPAYVEMALALSDRILIESESPNARIPYAFRLTVARQPSPREVTIVNKLLTDRLSYFQDNPGSAEQLLSNPQFVYKPGHSSKIELAAWFFVANALLNLDETITRN